MWCRIRETELIWNVILRFAYLPHCIHSVVHPQLLLSYFALSLPNMTPLFFEHLLMWPCSRVSFPFNFNLMNPMLPDSLDCPFLLLPLRYFLTFIYHVSTAFRGHDLFQCLSIEVHIYSFSNGYYFGTKSSLTSFETCINKLYR